MDAGVGAEVDSADDIQARVLKTTLAEVETLRQEAGDSEGPDAENPPDCCVICLDAISDPCAALPCTHAHFDFLCLVSWLEQHPNCPLCKANVYKVRYADAQKGEAVYRVPNASRARDAGPDERGAGGDRHPHIDSTSRRRFSSQNGILRETGRRCPRAPPTPDEAIQRRRHIYRHNLYSLHIGSNRISQYRSPPTPVQFSSTPHLVSRARLWLRRELSVFSFLSSDNTANPPEPSEHEQQQQQQQTQTLRRRANAEFLLEYIVAILKTVDIQGSAGQAEAMLADFLGREHARLFLHELRSWLRSPALGLAGWDREVQYPDVGSGGGVVAVEEVGDREGGREVDDEREEGYEREGGGGRGVSWRDRGGDHWRAGDPYTGERGKRRRGESDEAGEGRMTKSRRGQQAGR